MQGMEVTPDLPHPRELLIQAEEEQVEELRQRMLPVREETREL